MTVIMNHAVAASICRTRFCRMPMTARVGGPNAATKRYLKSASPQLGSVVKYYQSVNAPGLLHEVVNSLYMCTGNQQTLFSRLTMSMAITNAQHQAAPRSIGW